MNREELERMFDICFPNLYEVDYNYDGVNTFDRSDEVKDFIFDTIIPEVLSSILVYEGTGTDPIIVKRKYTNRLIKQKAKSIYNITI